MMEYGSKKEWAVDKENWRGRHPHFGQVLGVGPEIGSNLKENYQ